MYREQKLVFNGSSFVRGCFRKQVGTGNPAGICLLDEPMDLSWMQLVAREMNLSETAFLHTEKDGFSLRWFTPTAEVDLCGHATLASAHIFWEQEYLETDRTRLASLLKAVHLPQ